MPPALGWHFKDTGQHNLTRCREGTAPFLSSRPTIQAAWLPDARALVRAVVSTFSRVGDGTVYVDGLSMNPSDAWSDGDHRIDVVQNS